MSNWLEIRGTLCAYKYLQLVTIDSRVRVNFDPTIILTGMAFDPCWAVKPESPNLHIERVSEGVLSLMWSMIREQTPGWHPSHPANKPPIKRRRSEAVFFPLQNGHKTTVGPNYVMRTCFLPFIPSSSFCWFRLETGGLLAGWSITLLWYPEISLPGRSFFFRASWPPVSEQHIWSGSYGGVQLVVKWVFGVYRDFFPSGLSCKCFFSDRFSQIHANTRLLMDS